MKPNEMPFLSLSRTIRAPRQKVYDAFVKPEILAAWFGPRGFSVPTAQLDARPGGRYRITMRARTGESHTVAGEYREVVPGERLVFSWQWQDGAMANLGETLVTVTFADCAEGTEVRLRHEGFAQAADRDAHQGGWSSSLNCLLDAIDERGSAATISVFGDPRSTYVRTVRMALAEKGIAYALDPQPPGSETMRALHPFDRIPAFRDGEFSLYEASAIVRYLDDVFEGPSLIPDNANRRAMMEQWISAFNSYLYPVFAREYILQYAFPRGKDGKPDRAVIDAALPRMKQHLQLLDRAYGGNDFLTGSTLSIADLFLAPVLGYVASMPEGPALLDAAPNVRRTHQVIAARESFRSTRPNP